MNYSIGRFSWQDYRFVLYLKHAFSQIGKNLFTGNSVGQLFDFASACGGLFASPFPLCFQQGYYFQNYC